MSSGPEAGPDHDLDLAIRQLLEQQAGIQARLAALVAAKHGFDSRRELDHLRAKLRILEDIVDRNGMLVFCLACSRPVSSRVCANLWLLQDLNLHVPVLSEAEEARAVQYRCECLEFICAQQSRSHPTLPAQTAASAS